MSADIFAAVRIDDETQDLYITLFIDTDWQELVQGQIFIHTWDLADEKTFQVDFSKAIDGVYVHKLRFAQEQSLPGYDIMPAVAVTNMADEPKDVFGKVSRILVSGNDVNAHIIPRLVEP